MRDEAWADLKHLTRGSKEIIELAGEAEKFAKRLHPRDEEAAERHAVDAFLSALDRPLAAEVRKLDIIIWKEWWLMPEGSRRSSRNNLPQGQKAR